MHNQCVFCATLDNLNTVMAVKLDDGTTVKLYVCDVHAEDATVRAVRAIYLEKQAKLQELLEQAKALGFQVALQVPSVAPQALPVQLRPLNPAQPTSMQPGPLERVVSTERLDNERIRSIGGGDAGTYDSYDMREVPDNVRAARSGHATVGMVEGRGGQPIPIPKRRVDEFGVTDIAVIKTGGDQALQRSFKNMAGSSADDRGPDFARGGYDIATCPKCRGEMLINGVPCERCGGSGILPHH